jgi:hypothetical protein
VKRWKRIGLAIFIGVAITGVALALLWHFVGAPSNDALRSSRDYTCWRCLDDVALATSTNGWAVGEVQPYLLHYANGAWEWEPGPPNSSGYGWFLTSVALVSPNEGWAVGGDIQHFRDGKWTEELNFGKQTVLLDDVAAASPQEAWAVGGSWYSDFGFIWRYQDGAWSKVYTAPNMDVVSVSAPAVGDAWAVAVRYRSEGHPSGSSLLHYHDGAWTDAFDSTAVLHAVAMTSPTDGWATGNDASGAGIFLHYADGAWKQAVILPDTTLYNITMASADEGWATGAIGEHENALFHYQRGEWSPVADPVVGKVDYLRGIAAPAPGTAWVVALIKGSSRTTGVLLHYQDGTWSTMQIPKTPAYDKGQVIGLYVDIGVLTFVLVTCFLLFVMSFWAPLRSVSRHWLMRVILAIGALECAGILVPTLQLLFADDLAVSPNNVPDSTNLLFMIPIIILFGCFAFAAAVMLAQRSSQTPSSGR